MKKERGSPARCPPRERETSSSRCEDQRPAPRTLKGGERAWRGGTKGFQVRVERHVHLRGIETQGLGLSQATQYRAKANHKAKVRGARAFGTRTRAG